MKTSSVVVLIVAGVTALATGVLVFGPWHSQRVESGKPAAERAFVAVPKVHFTDVTGLAGIKFAHTNGAFGKKLLPETMGSGVAVLDFDNDGRPDLLFVNSRPWPGDEAGPPAPTLALYRNKGDGTFEDVTEKMGLAVPLYGMGATIGDFDNDGWCDIFITAIGGNKLFRNEGGQRFVDVTAEAGVGGPSVWPAGLSRDEFLKLDRPIAWPTSATFVDFDGDGKLDLFVCHYVAWSPAADLAMKSTLDGVTRAYGQPKAFEGAQCVLYRNIDGKHFEDVSAQAGVQVTETTGGRQRGVGKALGVVLCDPDEDGWPDIVVANDTVRNFFFHNVPGPDGTRRYEEIGLRVGMALVEGEARGGMGIDWGEYRPGQNAVVIANYANEPTTFLVQNRPKLLSFADAALAVGVSGPSQAALKFGTFFLDYDLDGRLDLLTNNGHLEPDIDKTRQGQSFAQSPQAFWNTGEARGRCFEPTTPRDVGEDLFRPMVGRGSAYLDMDGDGDLDVVLTANGGPVRLLRNDCGLRHHWVRFTLQGDGRRSNRSAIGARVTVEAGGQIVRRTVIAARGYLSQSELPVTVGLGRTEKIDRVTIQWPGRDAGPDSVLTNVAIDKAHVVQQGS